MFAHPGSEGYWLLRTIDWELGSSGRVDPPCHKTIASCLDVLQINGRWTVTMIGWVINALFMRCVGVRGAAVGVVAPMGVAIQVTGLSYLVGGFTGRSVWLPLVSRWAWLWCRQISVRGLTVVCPGGFGIWYKCRAMAGSSSLDTAPVTGSLLFTAPVCRLTVYCAAGLSWCVC